MTKQDFVSRAADRAFSRTTIAKRRRMVLFPEEQTIYNPDVLTWAVLKQCQSKTLENLANLQKGFRRLRLQVLDTRGIRWLSGAPKLYSVSPNRWEDPYERNRLRREYDRIPMILFRDREPWTNMSMTPTPAVEHYLVPKPHFLPPNKPSKEDCLACSCTTRNGLQYNCVPILMKNE